MKNGSGFNSLICCFGMIPGKLHLCREERGRISKDEVQDVTAQGKKSAKGEKGLCRLVILCTVDSFVFFFCFFFFFYFFSFFPQLDLGGSVYW